MTRARTRRLLVAGLVISGLCLQGAAITRAANHDAGPPPTPVPPNGSRSPFPQSLATPADATARPDLDVAAALLVDLDRGRWLYAKAPEVPRPIASLTKIMTALLVLERREPGDHVRVSSDAVFRPDEFGASSTLGLRAGERRTVRELLNALLLQSANDAAVALAIDVSGSESRFIMLMNRKARALGMDSTRFSSANGLDDRGRSTARDLAVLVQAAFARPGFASIVKTKFATIGAPPHVKPRHVQNRNPLLWLYPGSIGVKTGSTAGARYCLIAVAERDGRRLLAIVLGSPTEASSEAATLLNYGFDGFTLRTFATAGEELGTVEIRGGAVEGVASGSLEALVPIQQEGQVRERIVPAPDAVYPPATGQRIGTLKLTLPGVTLGTVPVLVRELPQPPPAEGGPWWASAIRAVGGALADAVGGPLGSGPADD